MLRAAIQAKPATFGGSTDGLHLDLISAEADDYDTAYEHLTAQIPDGWRMLWVNRP